MNFLIMMFAHYDNQDNAHNDFHDYALWRWWSIIDDQGASEREDPVQQGEGNQGHDDDDDDRLEPRAFGDSFCLESWSTFWTAYFR